MTDPIPARLTYQGVAETFDGAYDALRYAVETARTRHPDMAIESAAVHRQHSMPGDRLSPGFGWRVDLERLSEESPEPF